MKIVKFYILVFGFMPFCLFSQQDKMKFPFNEVILSINKTPNYAEGQLGYLGFGAGINRRYRDQSSIGFVMGIHYNYSSQYLDGYQSSRAGYHSDITYTFHTISIPVTWRYKFGNDENIFFEVGGSFDIIPVYKKSYTYTTSYFLSPEISVGQFAKKTPGFNLSGNAGIGAILSIGQKEVLIKLEYKIGAANFGETYWPTQPIHDQFTRFTIGYLFNKGLRERLDDFFKDY
tara:strand:+ start:67 stop:759 length:693 start_codon:yes stop_codon:yes gene_type:complete